MKSFERGIYNNDSSLDDAIEQQIRLKADINILKNLHNQKNQSKKKKKLELLKKMKLYFLMESKNFLILLIVDYFQKENKEKDFQEFWIGQLRSPTVRSLTIHILKY